jgi:hypothetical protein
MTPKFQRRVIIFMVFWTVPVYKTTLHSIYRKFILTKHCMKYGLCRKIRNSGRFRHWHRVYQVTDTVVEWRVHNRQNILETNDWERVCVEMGVREVIMKCGFRYVRNSTVQRCRVTDMSLYSKHIQFEFQTVDKLLRAFPCFLATSVRGRNKLSRAFPSFRTATIHGRNKLSGAFPSFRTASIHGRNKLPRALSSFLTASIPGRNKLYRAPSFLTASIPGRNKLSRAFPSFLTSPLFRAETCYS